MKLFEIKDNYFKNLLIDVFDNAETPESNVGFAEFLHAIIDDMKKEVDGSKVELRAAHDATDGRKLHKFITKMGYEGERIFSSTGGYDMTFASKFVFDDVILYRGEIHEGNSSLISYIYYVDWNKLK